LTRSRWTVERERGGGGIRSSQYFLFNVNIWGPDIGLWKRAIFHGWRSEGFIMCGSGGELVTLVR